MKNQRRKIQTKLVAAALTIFAGSSICGAIYAAGHGHKNDAAQETESAREKNAASTTLNDQTRSECDRLQLQHCAGARCAAAEPADRNLQPEIRGHRRHRQSRDGAFPFADRSRTS